MLGPFLSLSQEVAFWIVAAGMVLWTYWLHGPGAQRFKEPMGQSEKRQNASGVLVVLFAVGLVTAIGYAQLGPLPNWVFYPGLAMIVLGILLTQWASSILGKYYSPVVRIRPDHIVIQRGPYRLIRHPMYAGEILSVLGFGLAVQSYVALLVISALIIVIYTNRTKGEERLLADQLGDQYIQYVKRTKHIIPFVLVDNVLFCSCRTQVPLSESFPQLGDSHLRRYAQYA